MSDVTKDELAQRLGEVELLDVRSAEEFSGAAGYPCDPRQGHIPGARHVDVRELVGRTPDELVVHVGLPAGTEVVVYCHSGQRSALAADVLRAAGYDARNYPGSWHEWSRAVELPAVS